jgi:peptidoglycan/LPS O-acetylase OafA/YrhL
MTCEISSPDLAVEATCAESPSQAKIGSDLAERRLDIDGIKAVAIIGVLLAHTEFKTRLSAECLSVVHNLQVCFGWCVMAFFFCAGLLIKPPPFTVSGLLEFARRRARRLLVPCLIFSLSYRLVLFGVSRSGLFHTGTDMPRHVGEWVWFLLGPVGPQFYFLPYLFAVSVLSIAVLAMVRRLWVLWSLFAVIHLLSPGVTGVPNHTYGSWWDLLPAYTFCFWCGLLSRHGCETGRQTLVSSAAVAAAGFLVWQSPFFVYPLVPVLLLHASQKAPAVLRTVARTGLGEKSGAIYVWHAPVILPFFSIVCHRLVSAWAPVAEVPLTFILAIAVCYGLNELTHRTPWMRPLRF